MSSEVQIAVSTVERTPLYVHETLESMLRDPRAERMRRRLVVSGTSALYLGSWLGRADVEVLDKDAAKALRDVPPEGRCLANFERVLDGGDGPLLAFEDDVVFTEDWTKKLDEALARVVSKGRGGPKRRHGEAFVLALYAARKFKLRPVASYNPLHFYGNQALYLSGPARVALRSLVKRERAAGRPRPGDMFVKMGAQEHLYDLLACNPNLCQHIGERSSLGLRQHKSPSFRP